MATNRRDVELALRVKTEGAEGVTDLAGDIKALGGEGERLGTALTSGAAGADKLGAELAQLSAATKAQRAAEAAAAAEVAKTKRTLDEQRDALARLRATYAGAGGDAAKYKADVAALRLAILDSRAALRDKQAALSAASSGAKNAAAAEQQLTAQVKQAGDASRKAAADVATVGKSAGDTAGMLRQLGPLLAGAFSVQQFTQAITASESLHRSFEQIFGSAGRAAEELAFVKDMANRLGVENLALAKSYQSISAATKGTNLEGDQTRAVFEAIVRAMSTLGKSTAETERALVAVQQIASKGTASMEELRGQLGEALPGALQAAAKGAGITTEQLIEMVSTGKVLASDLLPALTKGLNDLYGNAAPPDNIISNWARLKNVLTETAVAVGEGGASNGLAKALSGAAIAVQGASAEVDILGTALGEMVAAVVTGNFELGTGEELANKYADALRKSAETAGLAEAAQAGLTAAQQQGNQTAAESFRSMERLADKQQQASASLLKIKVDYAELAKAAGQYTEQLEREQKARAAEGDALVKLVNLYGTEAERLQAVTQAAETNYAMSQRLARSREVEAITAQSLSIRLKQEALDRNDNTEATRKELEAAEKNAQAKNAEAEQSKASAAAKRIEAEAAKVAAAAYQDNAARVYELRGAAAQANLELARLVELEKQGKASADDVAAARTRAAGATALYRDALADATAAAERRVAAEQQQAQAAQAAIGVEMERAKAAREVAEANGDAVKAGALSRQESALQVQAYQQEADSARAVAQAIRDAVARKEEELRATGALTAAKREEIEAARRSADLKDIEAQKADILADKIRKLADSEQARTAALEKSIAAQEKAIELAERQRALEERKRTAYNTAGEAVNMGGQTLISLIESLKGYGLDDKRAQEIARQFTDSKGDVPYFNNPGQRMYGADTLSMALQKAASQALYGGGAKMGGTAAPAAPAAGSTRTININIGGRTSTVKVASEADGDMLVNILRQLQNAMGTAA
jgi:tape measure domain-containing protein